MSGLQSAADQALATTETYVAACQAVGRARITADRVRELYCADDGSQLSALDADGAALGAAAVAASDAAALEHAAVIDLAQAWRGGSGSAATDFLGRQCAAGSALADGLSEAAAVLRSLRSRLADLADARREATVRIADRRSAERPVWLARARSVLAGTADEADVDTVRREVAPFVDVDIAGDWASTMMSISEAVASAYRAAGARLDDLPLARFEIPADATPAPSRPVPPPDAPPPPADPVPVASTSASPAPPAPVPAAGPMPAIPDVGVGPGPGLSPALPGSPGPALADPVAATESLPASRHTRKRAVGAVEDTADETADEDRTDAAAAEQGADAVAEQGVEPMAGEPAPGAPVGPPAAADPVSAPPVEAPPPPPPVTAQPAEAGFQPRTPCEIAADELPQVGQ